MKLQSPLGPAACPSTASASPIYAPSICGLLHILRGFVQRKIVGGGENPPKGIPGVALGLKKTSLT